MKAFRFGVIVRSARSRAEWMDQARKLEDLGYSSLTVPDHLAEMFSPMPALVSAAAATKTIRVGTTVLNNDFRHPVLVAREAATVDLLTDGRLELGLSAAYVKSEYEQVGLRFDLGGTRVERLAEAVVIVRRLLTGKRVTFAGRHYRVTDHTIYPLPVQQPHPPILIGGNGPQLLTLAAKEADIVGLTGITFSTRRNGAGSFGVEGGCGRPPSAARERGRRRPIRATRAKRAGAKSHRNGHSPEGCRGTDASLDTVECRGDPSEPVRAYRDRRSTHRRSPGAPDAVGHFLFPHP